MTMKARSFQGRFVSLVIAVGMLVCIAAFSSASRAAIIRYVTPNQPNAPGATDLKITLTDNNNMAGIPVILKGSATLPLDIWDANDTTIKDNKITFNSLGANSTVPQGKSASGTLVTQGAANGIKISSAAWSYNKGADVNIAVAGIKVTIAKKDPGGLFGEVILNNTDANKVTFSNFQLSYNIPASYFGTSNTQLDNLTLNNLYISAGVPVSESLTSLDAGATEVFDFGLGSVNWPDYIGVSFTMTDSSGNSFGLSVADNGVPEPSTLVLGGIGLMSYLGFLALGPRASKAGG